MNAGVLSALGAFGIWGFLPLYWKALEQVSAMEIMLHRMVWSMLFVALLLLLRRRWQTLKDALRQPVVLLNALVCALLLAVNWLTYIWGVNQGYIIETSLGYYINPLMNVLLGVLVLNERLRPLQWLAISLAACGVLYLTLSYGQLPWIALTLAGSFAIYSLLHKKTRLSAMDGLALETGMLFLPALCWLGWLHGHNQATTGTLSDAQLLILVGAGVITAVPLLLFAFAAQRMSLATLGILQYLGPTIQLLIGILVYNEDFSGPRALAFSLIWLALVLYSLESLRHHRRQQKVLRASST
ncbi:MAG: EamA family transporter RarD [Marinobacterium sp.]|nr:EamA family transporter RarD [Marinobacterium sp.]